MIAVHYMLLLSLRINYAEYPRNSTGGGGGGGREGCIKLMNHRKVLPLVISV